jgi:lysophospholipase L1-like esterase
LLDPQAPQSLFENHMKEILISSLAAALLVLPAFGEPGKEEQPGAGPFTSRPAYQNKVLASHAMHGAKDRRCVVFLGDSLTEWWPVAAAFPKLRVANRGIASDTTRGMLCRIQQTVLDLQPRAIVMLGGINDLRPNNQPPGTPDTIATNYRLMLEKICKHDPKTPVFVCEVLPSSISTSEVIRETNQAIEKVAADFPNAVLVRTHKRFLNNDGTQNMRLFSDGVHLKPAGYEVLQDALRPGLEKLIPKEETQDQAERWK